MMGSSIALDPRSRSINLEVEGTAVMLKCVAQHQCRGGWCGNNVEAKASMGGGLVQIGRCSLTVRVLDQAQEGLG